MKIKNITHIGFLCGIIFLIIFVPLARSSYSFSFSYQDDFELGSASLGYEKLMNRIFNHKLEQYGIKSYFPQVYEPSIQATYYALEILHALDRLDTINTSRITDFIMSFYDIDQNIFIDSYVKRYLDLNPSKEIFTPLSSLLTINCYAVLALEKLEALHLIDTSAMAQFIWDCYHPVDHLFIGRPFDLLLHPNFKIATIANTYFAILALDLVDNWDLHTNIKNDLVTAIASLQSEASMPEFFGGFLEDTNLIMRTMFFNDPTIYTCYYSVKSLEFFNRLDAMNTGNFHIYLQRLYNATEFYFYLSAFEKTTKGLNVVASALAIELAEITGFNNFSIDDTLNFIISHRNTYGMWYQSTQFRYHELIDTFQILRSLDNLDSSPIFGETDKDNIAAALEYYRYFDGYCLLSEDYTSLKLLHTIVTSFNLFEKTPELPITQIFLALDSSCHYDNDEESYRFIGCINIDPAFAFFHSLPLEYYSYGNQQYIWDIAGMYSQEITYYALQVLKIISRLSNFELSHDLVLMLDRIIHSQFLNENYSNNGAFLPSYTYRLHPNPAFQNLWTTFEDSYFALQSIVLLTSYLGIELNSTDLETERLCDYVLTHLREDASGFYFDPTNNKNIDNILEHTYYALSILDICDNYNLDSEKFKSFVNTYLNYTSLKNIFYSYQISTILDLNIYFDPNLIKEIIQQAYNEEIYEFSVPTSLYKISQEALYWVSLLEKQFSNPDYKDTNFFKDFGGEITHLMVLGGILITFPAGVIIISMKKSHINLLKKTSKFKEI